MKRALAERAKQSFDTVKAKSSTPPPTATDHRTPQQPPAVYGNSSGDPSTSSNSSRDQGPSSGDHLLINNKLLQNAGDIALTTTPAEQRAANSSGKDTGNSAASGSTSEPPMKIPRLERSLDSSSLANINNNNASPQSPRSPRNLPKKNILERATSSSGNFQRFPGDSALAAAPEQELSSSGRGSKRRIKSESDEEEEENSNSAFYLKHQNRALATELKSLQFAVKELEAERDARRRHCHEALHAVHQLQNTWTLIEEQTVGSTDGASAAVVPDFASEQDDPPSTGTSDSVEWTRALHKSLLALGHGHSSEISSASSATALQEVTTNIAARAKILQEWLGTLLKSGVAAVVPRSSSDGGDAAEQRLHNLHREMGIVTAKCAELEAQVSELAASRMDIASRERRLRRNVYRMAAGIMTSEQVVNTLERGEGDELEAEVQLEKQSMAKNEPAEMTGMDTSNQKQIDAVSTVQLEEYKAKITALDDNLSNAEKSIQDLSSELSAKEQRITELSKRQLSEDEAAKLESLETTLMQLKTVQKTVTELGTKLERTGNRWAQALGNEKAAIGALDELIGKFNKRWAEITNQGEPDEGDSPIDLSTDSNVDQKIKAPPLENTENVQQRLITELQHKLDQALENVRQGETTRENLKEALLMNGQLQSKLDEVKAKYAAIQAARTSNNSSSRAEPSANESQPPPSSSRDRDGSSSEHRSESSSRSEKLHRDYKRVRKELAAVTASKEAAKAKFERAEKERETLMESNVRLLKQIGEKDEMNAKSLSTILHLKSLTEKLAAERDVLEQQAKSASQLALAARLATNARERVSEEVVKEKKMLEERVAELEKQHEMTQSELNRITSEWSEESGKMAVKETELTNAMKRCDELMSDIEKRREEVRKLIDGKMAAEREAKAAKDRLEQAVASGNITGDTTGSLSHGGSFTVDQLKTQVSVLKNRLACPVCHYRDKECIILRCRHMHCKQCVEERISNRSRKCPTCNVKFSENDIGDVWL